jgi:hypothetical protein
MYSNINKNSTDMCWFSTVQHQQLYLHQINKHQVVQVVQLVEVVQVVQLVEVVQLVQVVQLV